MIDEGMFDMLTVASLPCADAFQAGGREQMRRVKLDFSPVS